MTYPASEPLSVSTVDIKKPVLNVTFGLVVQAFSLVLMGVAIYLLWKGDKRLDKSDAAFRNTLHTVEERSRVQPSDTQPNHREGFSAPTCTVDCAEGHTYQPGCVQRVESDGQQTGSL